MGSSWRRARSGLFDALGWLRLCLGRMQGGFRLEPAGMSDETLLQFPCRFPIKVLADTSPGLVPYVRECVAHHVSDSDAVEWNFRESRAGHYLGITVTLTAHSQDQLDSIYRALASCPGVRMIL